MEDIFLAQGKLNENTALYRCWDRGATTEEGSARRSYSIAFCHAECTKLIGWPEGKFEAACVAMVKRIVNLNMRG
jgi:hypothetical protein